MIIAIIKPPLAAAAAAVVYFVFCCLYIIGLFAYALAYILLVTVLVCTYCVNFFGSSLDGHFVFYCLNLYIIGCFLLFVYNWLV